MCFIIRETMQKPYTLNLKSILRSRSLPVIRYVSCIEEIMKFIKSKFPSYQMIVSAYLIFFLPFMKLTFDKSIPERSSSLIFFAISGKRNNCRYTRFWG